MQILKMKKFALPIFIVACLFSTACKKKLEEKPAPDTTKPVDEFVKAAPTPIQALASDTTSVG